MPAGGGGVVGGAGVECVVRGGKALGVREGAVGGDRRRERVGVGEHDVRRGVEKENHVHTCAHI